MSQQIVKLQLRRRLSKAASDLGLHYLLWYIYSTLAVKVFNQTENGTDILYRETYKIVFYADLKSIGNIHILQTLLIISAKF